MKADILVTDKHTNLNCISGVANIQSSNIVFHLTVPDLDWWFPWLVDSSHCWLVVPTVDWLTATHVPAEVQLVNTASHLVYISRVLVDKLDCCWHSCWQVGNTLLYLLE